MIVLPINQKKDWTSLIFFQSIVILIQIIILSFSCCYVNARSALSIRYKLIILVCSFVFVESAYAQESIDLFTISGRYGVPRPYKSVYSGKATETGLLVNLKAPIPLNKSKTSIWYNNLTYTQLAVNDAETMPSDIANPISVYGFILQTGEPATFDWTVS